jgi:protein-disulfide isomerase
MSNAADSSKRAKRDNAREAAREMREKERKRKLRNRIIIQGSLGVVVLAIVLVVVLIIVNTNKQNAESATGPGPKNMASGGILFTAVDGKTTPTTTGSFAATATPTPTTADYSDGLAHIVTYIDWSCPACKSFEASYSTALSDAVAGGTATLEIHPIAILDRSYLGSRYSSRAANVAACMANYDPAEFLTAQNAFYDGQPSEGTTGLTNTQMKKLLTDAGITNEKVMSCIDSETFKTWVTNNTARTTAIPDLQASSGGFATPTVTVDGIKWDSTATPDFGTFVTNAVAQATGTPVPTESATPSATPTN